MLGAVIAFGVMVLFVKLLREAGMETTEVMLWRMAPGIPIAALLLRRQGRSWRPARPRELAGRIVFGGTAMTAYFWAIPRLSLFFNTAIALTQPIFVALLSPWLLGERANRTVIASFALALLGTALVVTGSGGTAGIAVGVALPLLPLAARMSSSVTSATAHIFIRRTTRPTERGPGDAPDAVVLHFTAWVAAGCLVLGLLTNSLHGPPPTLGTLRAVGYLLGMAGAGVAGQLMLSRAYARGRAPAVAVMGYAAIPLSLGFDAAIWNVSVQPQQLAGVTLTAVAGWLLVSRR